MPVPALIPPAYGLSGVHSVTYTGDGDRIAYWNRYVAVTQMHGHGSLTEPRLGISVSNPPDMVESKLADLEAYQLSLASPAPPAGSYDAAAATRGQAVFAGAAGDRVVGSDDRQWKVCKCRPVHFAAGANRRQAEEHQGHD